ncbi:MAG: hypothetical protein IPL28_18735 [Chloroflexi bacterium]|nr:hypothetical protein [Chloroflexota bacterium]
MRAFLSPTAATPISLTFSYDAHSTPRGTYYTLAGQDDILFTGGRPVQPRQTVLLNDTEEVAHGVIMVGGSFTDLPHFDPVITEIITEQLYLTVENNFPITQWYPVSTQSVNRFLAVDAEFNQRLVVVPGQFLADADTSPTLGTQRLYDTLELEVYSAPHANSDFVPPTLGEVTAELVGTGNSQIRYVVEATDTSGIQRVIVLYRTEGGNEWLKLELPYNSGTSQATLTVEAPYSQIVEYFIQVVDGAGNVARGAGL